MSHRSLNLDGHIKLALAGLGNTEFSHFVTLFLTSCELHSQKYQVHELPNCCQTNVIRKSKKRDNFNLRCGGKNHILFPCYDILFLINIYQIFAKQ